MSASRRTTSAALAVAITAMLLGACAEDGEDRPEVSPTRSVTASLPSPTRTPTRSEPATDSASPEPSASSEAPEQSETPESSEEPEPSETVEPSESEQPPTQSQQPTRAPTRTSAPTPTEATSEAGTEPSAETTTETTSEASPSSTATPSPTTSPETADETGEDSSSVPTWVWWWLAALLGLALAGGAALVLRSRRRSTWRSDLAAATGEVTWLARELVPELRRAGSPEQTVGGWAVSAERARALEDRLTALEATAPDDAGQLQARTLRDAVRAAVVRLEALADPAAGPDQSTRLDSIANDLEAALRSVGTEPGP